MQLVTCQNFVSKDIIYNLRYVMIITIRIVIVSDINLLKFVFLDGEKIFTPTSAVLLLDLSSNRFLHFEKQFESFSAYVADYF